MIISNDSISKFYQCNIPGFCQGIFMFLVSASGKKKKKKNAKNQIIRNLKKYVSKNKIYLCLKKKSNVSNISNIFKLDFITLSLFTLFFFFDISF